MRENAWISERTVHAMVDSMIRLAPLRVQLALYAFSLSFSTAAIKAFSVLSGIPMSTGLYVAGGVASVPVFSLFATFMTWVQEQK